MNQEQYFTVSHIKCRDYQIISNGRMKTNGVLNMMISRLIEKSLGPQVARI